MWEPSYFGRRKGTGQMAHTVGIVALQGCCDSHQQMLKTLGVESRRVLETAELDGLDALILPGGESTTMLKTARPGFWDAVKAFAESHPVWGICAGSILLADEVTHPEQESLGLIDMEISRNAWGAQNESFTALLDVGEPVREFTGIFIRAPRIVVTGESVEVLARFGHEPVMVRQGNCLATTFHPELGSDPSLHRDFLGMI